MQMIVFQRDFDPVISGFPIIPFSFRDLNWMGILYG